MPEDKNWYRDHYLVSTSRYLLQPSMIDEAFASEDMWWIEKLDKSRLSRMLDNSCWFGLYAFPDPSTFTSRQLGEST